MISQSPDWIEATQEEAERIRADWRPKVLAIAAELALDYYWLMVDVRRVQIMMQEQAQRDEWYRRNMALTAAHERMAPKLERALDDKGDEGWKS